MKYGFLFGAGAEMGYGLPSGGRFALDIFRHDSSKSKQVFIYAKLPKGFYIPTPVGHYSPDWAIVFHEGKVKHIYFVAETKGTMESLNLRPIEKSKIDCAKKLFAKLSDGLVTYDHVDSYQELMNKVLQ